MNYFALVLSTYLDCIFNPFNIKDGIGWEYLSKMISLWKENEYGRACVCVSVHVCVCMCVYACVYA